MSNSSQSCINMVKWKHKEDGPLSDKTMASKLDKMGYRSMRYVFHPGTDFPDHTHPMTKMDAITSGQFSVTMHGQRLVMEPGDIIEVPKNTVHSAEVVGNEPVVFFDSTKSA